MKIIDQINDISMKVAKGMIAIFAIKLLLLLVIFTFQACQSDSLDDKAQEEAKSNFLASLKQSSQNLNSIEIGKLNNNSESNNLSRNIQAATYTVCLMEFTSESNSNSITEEMVNSINTLTELIQLKTNNNLITQFDLVEWNEVVVDEEAEEEEPIENVSVPS